MFSNELDGGNQDDPIALLVEENEAHKALLEQQKRFMDILCHELRNPLSGIAGSLELLEMRLGEQKKKPNQSLLDLETLLLLEEPIKDIKASVAHQTVIINDVLEMSRLDSAKLKLQTIPFEPSDIIKEVCKMLSIQARNKNTKLKMSSELFTVVSDPGRLRQILINLVVNAIKFTENGIIDISLKVLENDSEFCIFEITVKDTGIGMTAEEQSTLFKRFSQVSSHAFYEYGGSGLGLWISKQLVELMGGTITVKSEPKQGSEFSFSIKANTPSEALYALHEQSRGRDSLPLSCPGSPDYFGSPTSPGSSDYFGSPTSPGSPDYFGSLTSPSCPVFPPCASERPEKNIFILLVEDNLINQKIIKKLLISAGYQVLLANDGLEAITQFEKFKQEIKVILMDIEMPNMGGIEATRAIRLSSDKVPIIGLSGNEGKEHEALVLEAGMNAYLSKPVEKILLYQTIQANLLKIKTSTNFLPYLALASTRSSGADEEGSSDFVNLEKSCSLQLQGDLNRVKVSNS